MDEHKEEDKKAVFDKLNKLIQEVDEFRAIAKAEGKEDTEKAKALYKLQADAKVTVANMKAENPLLEVTPNVVPTSDTVQNTLATKPERVVAPPTTTTEVPQNTSIEGMLDKTLNDYSTEEVHRDYAYVAPIVLTATVPADTVFLTILLGIEVQSPKEESLTVEAKVDNTGISILFTPYLFIDGPLNGRLFSVYFNFSTGGTEVNAKGLLGQLKSTVEKELQKLVKDTILDKNAIASKLPYQPFEDEDLKGTLAMLQKQVMAKFAPKPGEEVKPDKPKTLLPPINVVTLSAGMVFKENFVYNFGIGQATIPTGHSLLAKIELKGNLNQLKTIKIPYVGITSEGIKVMIDNKLEIIVRKITLRYGGNISLDEVEIKSENVSEKRLADALNVVLDELVLPIVSAKVKTIVMKLIEDKIDAVLVGRGIDAKQALGLV